MKEETDLDIKAVDLVAVTNDVFEKEGKHYITLFVWCNMEDLKAEPKVLVPNPPSSLICPLPSWREKEIVEYRYNEALATNQLTTCENNDRSWSPTSARAGSGCRGTRSRLSRATASPGRRSSCPCRTCWSKRPLSTS